jgi:hypothetical protein
MVAVLFLCAAFWSVGTLTREFGGRRIKRTVRTAFLIVLLVPIHTLLVRIPRFWWVETRACLLYGNALQYAPLLAPVLLALAIAAFLGIIIRFGRQIEKIAIPAVMLEVPFVVITSSRQAICS